MRNFPKNEILPWSESIGVVAGSIVGSGRLNEAIRVHGDVDPASVTKPGNDHIPICQSTAVALSTNQPWLTGVGLTECFFVKHTFVHVASKQARKEGSHFYLLLTKTQRTNASVDCNHHLNSRRVVFECTEQLSLDELRC